jgi:spore coat protein U-like protein
MVFSSKCAFSKNEKGRSMKSALSVFALGFLAFGLAPRPAVAATASASFGVSATVLATCLVSAAPMKFGTYTRSAVSAASSVSVTCTNPTPYNVSLSSGLAPGSAVVTGKMIGSVPGLQGYALASNFQGTVNRSQTMGADTVAGAGNDSVQTLAAQDQVSSDQHVASSAYADTIIIAITY